MERHFGPLFPNQIGENPMLFATLQMLDSYARQLGAPEAATKQNGNHRVFARRRII